MGDRAQLKLQGLNGSIYLYTHSGGSELEQTLRRGLSVGRSLATDTSYCLASIVREFVRSNGGLDSETGMGVGFDPAENDNDRTEPLVLDIAKRTVRFRKRQLSIEDFLAGDSTGWN